MSARCPHCGDPLVASRDALGRATRCPRCDGVKRAPDPMHPSLAGREQTVRVEPWRTPPIPKGVEAPALVVPAGYHCKKVEGLRFSYVLTKEGTAFRTSFTAHPDQLQAVLEREIAMLDGETYTAAYADVVDEKPKAERVHPGLLPSEDPRAVAWRERIRRGVNQRDSWSEADMELLRNWYQTHGRGFRDLPSLAAVLKRSPKAVSRRAQIMGLTRSIHPGVPAGQHAQGRSA